MLDECLGCKDTYKGEIKRMEQLKVGRAKLTWLRGGVNFLDGGAMFGVVPKALWSKRYPYTDNNLIELRTDPILLQIDGKNILRSEEHTSELQSRGHLVCRLLLEK